MKGLKRLIFSLGAGALLMGCSEGDNLSVAPAHNVFTVRPVEVGGSNELTFPAVVEEARTIAVGFKTAGQIQRIYVKEGQRVSEGQTLAMLDTTDYALGISTLREKYRQMRVENERRKMLHDSGNMSDNDYENAVSGMRQLALQLQMEENKLRYCTLKAPASGVVTKVSFEESEMVDAGTPVFELMDNSRLEVVVDLPVRHYAERETFSGFQASSPLLNEDITLKLTSLTPRADNAQLYRMRLLPVGKTDGLTPGMNVAVKIHAVGNGGEKVSIPLSAVFDREGAQYVLTVNLADSVISALPIKIEGVPHEGNVTVSGLTGNVEIVRAGVHHLTDGEHVNILK
ncbi:MAG: efflux RND transporter periplasmic adaptor subunit [Bacteroides sp.]|nr:efflux RND transporter periplasmic adaptor subunit [Bacteroides sp.]MCM1378823.1 efflux RND transporter periplasmic adaptor subunit [Bacteroides sp.]MCM1445440.1 efflux RND transporter periplasmic adaptor subunit [Prevotella sp.]